MGHDTFDIKQYARTARAVVAEGIVMLRNEGGALPLREGERIALFGRGQFNYYKSGTGSGGMVNTTYVTGIREALEESSFVLNEKLAAAYREWLRENPFDAGAGWAGEPWFQKEMPLTGELVQEATEESDTAVIIIARTAGEDQDNKAEAGSYLLTADEEDMLRLVCGAFRRTVERYRPSSVLYVWQGGQEGGNGVLDVLSGAVSPSGKLTDTIAGDIADYPSTGNHGDEKRNLYQEDIYVGYRYFETFARDKVLYPFGFGLSYTTFSLEARMEEGSAAGGFSGAGLPGMRYGCRPGKASGQSHQYRGRSRERGGPGLLPGAPGSAGKTGTEPLRLREDKGACPRREPGAGDRHSCPGAGIL